MGLPTKARSAELSFAAHRRRLLAAAAAAIVAGCASPRSPQPPEPPQARVVAHLYYVGDPSPVRVERGGRAVAVSVGMALLERDFVETTTGYARIDFVAGGQVWLDVNTAVRVGSLFAFFGRIFAEVGPRFTVETQDVTASPEGTRFGVRRDRQTEDYAVVVETGRVRCTGRRLAFDYVVPAGSALYATPRAKPGPPKPLSRAELQAEIGWVSAAMSGARPERAPAKPTKSEVDRTLEAGNRLVAILNQVNQSLNNVGSSLDSSRYADARRSLDDATKSYESSNVPFETLKQHSGHEAFRAIYDLAAQMRDLQSRLLALSKRAVSQATGKDRKAHQEWVKAWNKLIEPYNAKVIEFNEKLRRLPKEAM